MTFGLLLLCVAVLFCGCEEEGGSSYGGHAKAGGVRELEDYDLGGDFALTDQDGNPFQLSQQRGRVILLFFGYTFCPDICPTTLSKLAAAYDLLGAKRDSVLTVFVSVDPERDTSEILKEYLGHFSIRAMGLTGDPDEIRAIARRFGAGYEKRASDSAAGYLVDHTVRTYLIDGKGRVRFLFRHEDPPELIASVVKRLF